MANAILKNNRIIKTLRFFLVGVFLLALPVSAAITHQRTPNQANVATSVSIHINARYPDDLIYDGSSGSVGLTLEPLQKMKWWGVAVYTETENLILGCVPTTATLPIAVSNLTLGDYKTAISVGETKEDCEAFTNEYPLFAILEDAKFTVRENE